MANEYLFDHPTEIGYEFDTRFDVAHNSNQEQNYLVSNVQVNNAEIYAPEINFYYEQSLDNENDKYTHLQKLYTARSISLDYSQVVEFSIVVDNNVVIISSTPQTEFEESLRIMGFNCSVVHPLNIISLTGHIGKLKLAIKGEIKELATDQVFWFEGPEYATSMSGVYVPTTENVKELVKLADVNSGEQLFANHVKYDKALCLYSKKGASICRKCEDSCSSNAILHNGEQKNITVIDANCQACGSCVSFCPSGALDYAQMPRAAYSQICSLYEGHIPLLVSDKHDLAKLDIKLSKGLLPFAMSEHGFLDEAHLLTLLQTAGNPILLYADSLSDILENSIRIVNEIFIRKYDRIAIYVCASSAELCHAFESLAPFDDLSYSVNDHYLHKREVFSSRLSQIVGDNDFGTIETGPHVHYGNMEIREEHCTLCLSCVEACPSNALTSNSVDNTLRYNPSICTLCGNCETTCPESNCLHLIYDKLALEPSYFKENVMAQDELFECVECGVGFAPKKSVMKIADIMKPVFAEDPLRTKSLSCCPDCKARIMLEALNINN